jgi:kynurenine 3-monooxygenase
MDTAQKVTYDFDYCIIGAGPAGLAAATMLAQQGVRVALFESRSRPENVFGSYPVVLNARGLAALETLGKDVMDKIFSVGMDVTGLHIMPNNRTVAKVKTYGTGIMRDQVAQVLLEVAESQDNLTLFWDHKFASIDFATHSCTFETASESSVSFTGARVVASDGNRSRIRAACEKNIDGFSAVAEPWGFKLRFMSTKGKPGQTEADPAVHYVLGDKGYICQQPDGVWSVSLRVLEDDEDFLTADEATDENIEKLKEYIKKYAGLAYDNLLDDEAYRGFYDCRAFDGLVVKCSTLSPLDWLCFVGDASHAVQPATGEGINSGLEDASVLAKAVRDQPEDPFTSYDAQHRVNAHALNELALDAKSLVVGVTPRQSASNIMTTIALSIGKKLHFVEGTKQDFMLGAKAKTVGVRSYAELVAMDTRQKRWLKPTTTAIAALFGAKDTWPDKDKPSQAVDSEVAQQEHKLEQPEDTLTEKVAASEDHVTEPEQEEQKMAQAEAPSPEKPDASKVVVTEPEQ